MSRVANIYWADERIRSQRVTSRVVSSMSPGRELSLDIIGTRADVRRRGGIIPSWVIFGMIILATSALFVTVSKRTRAKLLMASEQYVRIESDVETLRRSNAALGFEVKRLRSDPRAIESAARSQLNMVRANEIVVPVE